MRPVSDAAPSEPVATLIEVLHTPGCPHVDQARALLRSCLAELRLAAPIEDREGNYPSPTILVNGVDVMGRTDLQRAMCRLDLPTREHVLAALRMNETAANTLDIRDLADALIATYRLRQLKEAQQWRTLT